MTAGPPGFIPGLHIPGTLVPIGAAYEQQRQNQQAQSEQDRVDLLNFLLLTGE